MVLSLFSTVLMQTFHVTEHLASFRLIKRSQTNPSHECAASSKGKLNERVQEAFYLPRFFLHDSFRFSPFFAIRLQRLVKRGSENYPWHVSWQINGIINFIIISNRFSFSLRALRCQHKM
jgi:hypothetical protein